MRLWCDAAWAVVRRDATLYFSYRTQVITQTFSLLFSLALFYWFTPARSERTITSPMW
jgi:hypothetical protein